MIFLLKHTLRLFLLFLLLVFLYEITDANYSHFTTQSNLSLQDTLKAFLQNTNHALSFSLQLIHHQQFQQLKLVKHFLWVFNDRIYWLLLTISVFVSYYWFRIGSTKAPPVYNSKLSNKQFQQQTPKNTFEEVNRLRNSEKYRLYEHKKKQQLRSPIIDVDEEEDTEFMKDWEQNGNKIYD